MSLNLRPNLLAACVLASLLASSMSPNAYAEKRTAASVSAGNVSAANVIAGNVSASSATKTLTSANNIELVFVLDTTGSMGGLLEGAKSKIWSIVNDIMQKRGGKDVQVKVGLVAYRDRGDAYITKVTPLTENLDDVYAQLMAYRAEGGGDTPEDVRSALQDTLNKVGWSKPGVPASKIMFLVGDAPPHEDYKNVQDTTTSAKKARELGMIINTIQCGNIRETTLPWRNIAQWGGGEYFAIEQDGGVQVIATPYDAELASLGEKIGGTYMAYGHADLRKSKKAKQVAMEEKVATAASLAPAAAAPAAERAVNKAMNKSAYDESDLVQQFESGSLSLDKIADSDLPDELQALKPAERKAKLEQRMQERKQIKEKIVAVSKKREEFLAQERSKGSVKKTGFDAAVASALEKQIK